MKAKLHMNIDAQLKEALQVLASKENRNLTNYIEHSLRQLVAQAIKDRNVNTFMEDIAQGQ